MQQAWSPAGAAFFVHRVITQPDTLQLAVADDAILARGLFGPMPLRGGDAIPRLGLSNVLAHTQPGTLAADFAPAASAIPVPAMSEGIRASASIMGSYSLRLRCGASDHRLGTNETGQAIRGRLAFIAAPLGTVLCPFGFRCELDRTHCA